MLRCRFVLAFVAVMLLLFGVSAGLVFGFTESDAASAIGAAEEKIVLCYDAVAEADAAGANVTALLAALDRAGELLSKAELSYRIGDFDSAVGYAGQSQEELNGFVVEAEALEARAAYDSYLDFVVTFGGSIVGVVAVVGGSFVVWLFLKTRFGGAGVA